MIFFGALKLATRIGSHDLGGKKVADSLHEQKKLACAKCGQVTALI